jgi:hypothetical protein
VPFSALVKKIILACSLSFSAKHNNNNNNNNNANMDTTADTKPLTYEHDRGEILRRLKLDLEESELCVLAIDIETTGAVHGPHKVLALGASLMRFDALTGSIAEVDNLRLCFPCSFPQDYEDRCVEEFWEASKLVELRTGLKIEKCPTPRVYVYREGPQCNKLMTFDDDQVAMVCPQRDQRLSYEREVAEHGLTREQLWRQFLDFYAACEIKCPGFQLVSDNPSFDIGRINAELAQHLQEMPLEYRRVPSPAADELGIEKHLQVPRYKYRTARSMADVARGAVLARTSAVYAARKALEVFESQARYAEAILEECVFETNPSKKRRLSSSSVVNSITFEKRGQAFALAQFARAMCRQWADPKDLRTYSMQECPYSHDHDPLNDARTIAWKYLEMHRMLLASLVFDDANDVPDLN